MKKLFLLLLFFSFFAAQAEATTYYMGTAGNDSNSCATAQTIGTPKLTFNSAKTCLSPGDTLIVRDGVYTDQWVLSGVNGSAGNPITIRAENISAGLTRARPAINRHTGTTGLLQIFGSTYIDVRGIDFDAVNQGDTDPYGDAAVLIYGCSFNIRFDDNEVHNSKGTGLTNYPGTGCLLTGIENKFNWVHHNGLSAITTGVGHGIYVGCNESGTCVVDALIKGNRIEANTGCGIHNYGGDNPSSTSHRFTGNFIKGNGLGGGAGHPCPNILLYSGPGSKADNNIIIGAGSGSNGADVRAWSNDVELINNTIVGNAGHGVSNTQERLIAKNNIICDNGGTQFDDTGSGTTASNNLTTCPEFVNAAGDDYRLAAGATTAIGQGATLGSPYIPDYAGVDRTVPWDIGALKFVAAGSSVPRAVKAIMVD